MVRFSRLKIHCLTRNERFFQNIQTNNPETEHNFKFLRGSYLGVFLTTFDWTRNMCILLYISVNTVLVLRHRVY